MLVQTQEAMGVLRPFACEIQVGLCALTVPDLNLEAGQQGNAAASAYLGCLGSGCGVCNDDCGDWQWSASSYNWTTGNSSIASIASGATSASAVCQANGTGVTYVQLEASDANACAATGQGTVTVAVPYPTNFSLSAGSDAGGGTLHFSFSWASSTGNLSNLSNCTMGEKVTYQGNNPYTFPFRLPAIQVSNPDVNNFSPTAGSGTDDHSTPGTFGKPYSFVSITANQVYRYSCPGVSGGNWVTLASYDITRTVSQDGSSWKFTITKNGYSATINPLP